MFRYIVRAYDRLPRSPYELGFSGQAGASTSGQPEPTLPGRLPCSPLFTGVSERGARNPFIDAGFRERAVIPLLLPSSLAVARIITARIVAERNAETRTAGAARDAGSIGSARDRGRA